MRSPTAMRTAFISPSAALLPSCSRRRHRHGAASPASPRMSGVNGGIDYDIDLAALPYEVASRVRYVQGGPDSPTELISAARAIAAASAAHPATLPVLVDMLGFNNPVAANVAVDALACAGCAAVPPLLSGVAAFNYAVNAYALRALGRIGDPSVLEVCVQCAEKGPIPNVRRAACRALAGLKIEDQEGALRAHDTLVLLAASEPDWGVRYAAIVGLECFSSVAALPTGERQRGIDAVRATSEAGTLPAADCEAGDAARVIDPTVIARATVALAAMEGSVVAGVLAHAGD
jgi:phycocyanobilin lyase subunit beta